MFVYSSQTYGAMFKLKNRRGKNPVLFEFLSKNGQNSSYKVGFDIPLLQTCNLPPLNFTQEAELFSTWAGVYISYGFCTVWWCIANCKPALQQFMMILEFFKSKQRDEITIFWMIHSMRKMMHHMCIIPMLLCCNNTFCIGNLNSNIHYSIWESNFQVI